MFFPGTQLPTVKTQKQGDELQDGFSLSHQYGISAEQKLKKLIFWSKTSLVWAVGATKLFTYLSIIVKCNVFRKKYICFKFVKNFQIHFIAQANIIGLCWHIWNTVYVAWNTYLFNCRCDAYGQNQI